MCSSHLIRNIYVRALVSHLIEFKRAQGHVDGPAISDLNGRVLSHPALNDLLCETLEELFGTHCESFPVSIPDQETLRKRIQIHRTLCQTLDTRALEQKAGQSDIDMVNRWKALEQADGSRPCRSMRQHYAELELLIGPFLCYTLAM
jgi:hypothetical protein